MGISFKYHRALVALAAGCSLVVLSPAWSASGNDQGSQAAMAGQPKLETIATFGDDFKLVGIGVSKTGRVFASAPGGGLDGNTSLVEVDAGTGQSRPYPNAD